MSKVRYVDAFARIFTIYYWKWLLAALIVYIYLCECELMCMLQCSCWRQKTMRSLLRSREPQKLSSGHDLLMLPSTHQTISLALFVTLTIISARGKCIEHRVLKILRIPFIIYLCACICVCMLAQILMCCCPWSPEKDKICWSWSERHPMSRLMWVLGA